MNRQDLRIEIEALDAQMQAFEQSKAAAVQELHHQVERRGKVLQDRLNLFTGQYNRDVRFPLRPDNSVNFSKLPVQDMPMKKQQGIEGLVLG
jgi:hypothetical protein